MHFHSSSYRLRVLSIFLILALTLLPAPVLPAQAQSGSPEEPYPYAVFDPLTKQGPSESAASQSVEVHHPDLEPQSAVEPRALAAALTGQTTYLDFDTLIVIYPNTCTGRLTDSDVQKVEEQVRDEARFIWRHTHLKFSLNLTFLIINDFKDSSEFTELFPGGWWLNPLDDDHDGVSVEKDLIARGIKKDQFDSINYFWSFADNTLPAAWGGLGGGISWTLGLQGITEIPIFTPSGSDHFDFAFAHEIQHTIDWMLDASGHPEYFHPDQPWYASGAFGEDYSYWVDQMDHYPPQNYLDIKAPWGTVRSAADGDNDGVPDSGASLWLTESALGSSPSRVDTDQDGLSDLNEILAGYFRTTDLTNPDTDQDGLPDGSDPEPLYRFQPTVTDRTRAIDGQTFGWDLWNDELLSTPAAFDARVFTDWDSNNLYLMFYIDQYASVQLMIDANADGWFHGKDNYLVSFSPTDIFEPANAVDVRVWDCSDAIIAKNSIPMWDNDASYPYPRLVQPQDIQRSLTYNETAGGYIAQLAIPANPQTGMSLYAGKKIGVNLVYSCPAYNCSAPAMPFERNQLIFLTLQSNARSLHGFSDEFNQAALNHRWNWVDPLRDSGYDLSSRPGQLHLFTTGSNHDLYMNSNAPRMLQAVGEHFSVQTLVTASFVQDEYQAAGLLFWQDENNYVRLELKNLGNIRLISRIAGIYADQGNIPEQFEQVRLRLERSGDEIHAYYSPDGGTWKSAGSVVLSSDHPGYAGVHLINEWQENPIEAYFDYVTFSTATFTDRFVYLPTIRK